MPSFRPLYFAQKSLQIWTAALQPVGSHSEPTLQRPFGNRRTPLQKAPFPLSRFAFPPALQAPPDVSPFPPRQLDLPAPCSDGSRLLAPASALAQRFSSAQPHGTKPRCGRSAALQRQIPPLLKFKSQVFDPGKGRSRKVPSANASPLYSGRVS